MVEISWIVHVSQEFNQIQLQTHYLTWFLFWDSPSISIDWFFTVNRTLNSDSGNIPKQLSPIKPNVGIFQKFNRKYYLYDKK